MTRVGNRNHEDRGEDRAASKRNKGDSRRGLLREFLESIAGHDASRARNRVVDFVPNLASGIS